MSEMSDTSFRMETIQEKAPNTHRWNFEDTGNGIRICRGLHERSAGCEWEYYVLASELQKWEEDSRRLQWLSDNYSAADFEYPSSNGDTRAAIIVDLPISVGVCGDLRRDVDSAINATNEIPSPASRRHTEEAR